MIELDEKIKKSHSIIANNPSPEKVSSKNVTSEVKSELYILNIVSD